MNELDESRVIEMAWENRKPFEAIERLYGLSEPEVIKLMRRSIKAKSFRSWRVRVAGPQAKHEMLTSSSIDGMSGSYVK